MPVPEASRETKQQLRLRLLSHRARRTAADRERDAEALCARVCAVPAIAAATRMACYASLPEEPGTEPLIAALSSRGCEVLLPVLRPDNDLDWAAYAPGAIRSGRFGIREPSGSGLGVTAVSGVTALICPALAADQHGRRLGRGGGSYDRVLARLPDHVMRVALLFDDEVLDAVPTDEHDQAVDVIVTPRRTLTPRWREVSE